MKTTKTFQIQYSNKVNFNQLNANSKQKFNLYLRKRKMNEIYKLFLDISNYSQSERKQWLDDNKGYVLQLFETFIEDTILAMNGLQMDEELKSVSLSLITLIRDTTIIIRNIFKLDVSGVLN